MKKVVVIFCLLVLLIQFVQIIYFQRYNFAAKYDTEYWKDRYEHSQYELPLSKRTIGDDGLHAYAGYKLINGANPFSINIDKPPAGKYFLGLSIFIFQNPLYIVLFFGFCTLIVFYFIAKHFFKNNNLALFATTFLFLDPLFFSQFWITTLDLIQLSFLLLNILLLINVEKLRRWSILVATVSGLSLGIFAEVKPPIIFPVIFILETIFVFYKGFKKEYLFFLLGLMFGIVLPYLRFIYLGNDIIDILKVHKFMASIYLQSQLKTHIEAIWMTLLTGKFPNIVTGSLINVSEWWILWPVITLFGITMAIYSLFSKSITVLSKGFAVFLLIVLILFTVIPSYPRYLVIIFPFLYLFGIKFMQIFLGRDKLIAMCLVLLTYGIVNSFLFLLPKPESSLNGFYYNLSHLYFHDIYQENIVRNALGLTRSQFRHIANKAFDDARIRVIEIKELNKNIPIFATKGNVKIGITYKTQDLGSFYEEKVIELVQKEGIWKIKWDWNLVFNGFSPDFIVQTEMVLGKRGSIISASGEILAQDYSSYLVSVNPEKIDLKKENEMLKFISLIGDVKAPHLQNAYLENSMPGTYVPLVTLFYPLDSKIRIKLLSFPGVKITPYPSRIYNGIDSLTVSNTLYKECCTRIYSKNYHGIAGLEGEYDSLLSGNDGGSILIKDRKGNIIKTILKRQSKIGQDVVVPL